MKTISPELREEILSELEQAPDDESTIRILKSYGLTLHEAIRLD